MSAIHTVPDTIDFRNLPGWLESATPAELDSLPFGVVELAADFSVTAYNLTEARCAGLTPARVIGRPFFTAVAPCMNNALVAQRFAIEPRIDEVIDYVLTFRVAPTKVRLRLMKQPDAPHMYIAVQRC